MKNFQFLCASLFSLLTLIYGAKEAKSDCLAREKTLALLEIAEDHLTKAEDTYPSCNHSANSTDQSECSGKKSLAYIQISKKIISDLKENLPTCIGPKDVKPRDCTDILASGSKESGVYTIWLHGKNSTGEPLQVYCDMDTEGGGWMVIQRRGKFSVQEDFYRGWDDYADGFGNITRDFWLGNKNIHLITSQAEYEVRFDLRDADGERRYAVYNTFRLDDEERKFLLRIEDYSGNAGNSMAYHNNYPFNTKDTDNTRCANERKSGWWFADCTDSNLNGIYHPGVDDREGMTWYGWHNTVSLAGSEIKLRKKN